MPLPVHFAAGKASIMWKWDELWCEKEKEKRGQKRESQTSRKNAGDIDNSKLPRRGSKSKERRGGGGRNEKENGPIRTTQSNNEKKT